MPAPDLVTAELTLTGRITTASNATFLGSIGDMVQLWQDTDPEQTAVDLVPADEIPATGWKQVLEGEDENGRVVALVHEDTMALRRMTMFDAVVNNADRILSMADGHRYGVDHGLTFHGEH